MILGKSAVLVSVRGTRGGAIPSERSPNSVVYSVLTGVFCSFGAVIFKNYVNLLKRRCRSSVVILLSNNRKPLRKRRMILRDAR